MAAEIIQINSQDFATQEYGTQDTNLIPSFDVSTSLTSGSYIESFIYDINQDLLQATYNFNQYSVINDGQAAGNNNLSQITIDPEQILINEGYDIGQYILYFNFLNKQIGSNIEQLYINEISSDRTEIRLDSTSLSDLDIVEKTNAFIQTRDNSDYFLDFYLNFGDNQLIIANNIQLDTQDPNNSTILIKLYEALPSDFDLNSTLWVVTSIEESIGYQVNFEDTSLIFTDTTPIQGPNFNIDLKDRVNNSTLELSYTDLTTTALTSSFNQLSSLLEEKEIDINIDYSDFNNFIHFSSAQTRLENFFYKVSLIEEYNNAIFALNNTVSSSLTVNNNKTSLENQINDIITNFDGYEYYLYYETGSTAWPKTTSQKPYTLALSTSTTVENWFGSTNEYSPLYGGIILSASLYDNTNKDNLLYTVPEYLRDDNANEPYELFVNMVAQHYDNIWIYYNNVTEKYNADNRLEYGISKDIVADAIRDFGIKIYQNNFSNNDLFTAFLGLTPNGALFPYPNITGSLPTPSGFEYIDTLISASNDALPQDDVNKSLYKRIYHNLPYLLKSKGTLPGLRTLITSYGIPDTILRINEYGGKDKVNSNDWDYWQNEFNYSLVSLSEQEVVTIPFNSLNTRWNAYSNTPGSLMFRFKLATLDPTTTLVQPENLLKTDTPLELNMVYTGSGFTSGSYSGSIIDPYYQYATLTFSPQPGTDASISLPFYNQDWWSVMINAVPNGGNIDYTLYASNKTYEGGNNGTSLGFFASASVSNNESTWVSSTQAFYGTSMSGSLQEIRYYANPISESVFKDYVMNPSSIEGNSLNSGPNELAFRAPLGNELYTGSVSIHPKVTGSWVTTSSFSSDSNFAIQSTFESNEEYFFYDQPVAGIKNAISDKIRLEANEMPSGSTLSAYRKISQQTNTNASYTPNTNLLEVAFSPQDEINDDINSSIGFFNIGDYIGDPSQRFTPDTSYPDLDKLRNEYFEKYTSNYDLNDYINLIKYFDNSLFKMIKDFVPARTSLASGIVIKQHLLERNKYPQPQVKWSDLDILGTVKPQWNDYNEGTVEHFEGGTGGQFEPFNYASNTSQSWYITTPSISGSVTSLHSSQDEFYNGEFEGSTIIVTTQSLNQAYPLENVSFNYTPVAYSFNNYEVSLSSQFVESQFLNPLTVPAQGEILFLQNWLILDPFNPAISGPSYLKVHKLDNNGINNDAALGQIDKLLIKYQSYSTYDECVILEKTENPDYFLFKVQQAIPNDDYIKNYSVSSSKAPTIYPSSPSIPTIFTNYGNVTGNTLGYFNNTTGIYTLNNTPNIKISITGSAIVGGTGNGKFFINCISEGILTSLESINITAGNSYTISASYYGLQGDQVYLSATKASGLNSPELISGSLLLTQSIAPSAAENDSVIFEPYITSVGYYNSDNNPLINNAVDIRQSTIWEDLDYSQGALKPVNFEVVISGSAVKATVQDSNYSTIRHINPRYRGSRNTTDNFNTASITNTVSIENSQNIYLGASDTLYPSVTSNNTAIFEFAYGGGAYPEVANGGGVLISQILNVSGTGSVSVITPLNDYFENTFKSAFLPNSQPLITQYTTTANVANARVASTNIGVPTLSSYMIPSSVSAPNDAYLWSTTLIGFINNINEVTTGTGGYYTTGSVIGGAAATTNISTSISQGNDWYITIYNNLPNLVQGTLQPFNSGSLHNYSLVDNQGNYNDPLTVNGVYRITSASNSGELYIDPPLPTSSIHIGRNELGCLIWQSNNKPQILFNNASFSGVGKGNLITADASLIIKNNLDSLPKKYGTNV